MEVFITLKTKVSFDLIEFRTLILAGIFSFVWGFKKPLNQFAPLLLHRIYGYSMSEAGVIVFYLNETWYIQVVILFAIFFYICSQNIINKIGSTIVSAIIGNAIGFWVGYFASASLIISTGLIEEWNPLIAVNSALGQGVISLLFIEFAAMACAYMIGEWDRRLEQIGFLSNDVRKPITVYVSTIIYAVLGVLLLVFSFVFMIYGRPFNEFIRLSPFILFDLLLRATTLIIVSYGLYVGKRWGWLIALITSMLGAIAVINLLIFCLVNALGTSALIAYSIALLLNLILIACLLSASSRRYFRFLNLKGSF